MTDARLRLTVVVCTHRRPHLLAHLLATLEDVWDDPHDELVLVDDTPADDEVARLARTTSLPTTHLIVEGPGLSAARNHGWRAASGDVVVFLDDDSRPVGGTFAAYRRAFTVEADLAAAGGPLVLRWPGGVAPAWFSPSLSAYYSGLEPRNGEPPPHPPYGANMAFRRAVLESTGGFDEHLGRRGSSLLSGEETDLFARIEAGGGRVGWVRDAVVRHEVEPERANLRWLARRAVAQGRSDVRIDLGRGATPGGRALVAAASGAVVRGWGDLLAARGDGSFDTALARDLARRARRLGRAAELVAQRRGA